MLKKNSSRDGEQLVLAGTEEGEILQKLSERVEQAVQTIHDLRKERDALRTRVETAEKSLAEQGEEAKRLTEIESEHEKFRSERGEIRNRIESILSSLETLDEAEEEAAE